MYYVFLFIIMFLSIHCSGSSSTTSTTTVALSGQVAVPEADVSASLSASLSGESLAPNFETIATTILADATVTLVKISPDGTEEEVATTTTDSEGNYSFEDVDVASGGNGESNDFYYEIRATTDTVEVSAPVAPTEDNDAVNLSPETTLAAKILSDVVSVPFQDDKPTPAPETIEALRTLVTSDVQNLQELIDIPSLSTDSAEDVLATANGISATGTDSEKMYKTTQFESEVTGILADDTSTADDAASYIKRVIRESCDQTTSVNPVPVLAAEAMGEAMLDETTFTPEEICAAYNADAATDADCSVKVEAFADMLVTIEDDFAGVANVSASLASMDVVTTFDSDEQIALYTKRNLDGATLALTTELEADQALAFLQTLPDSENPCSVSNVDITKIISDLTDDADLGDAAIEEVQIYHNSGFGCNEGDNKGHFVADVRVYLPDPSVTIESVTIDSTDTTALSDEDGSVDLTQENPTRWVSDDDGVCVTHGVDVTYTVTVTLSDSSTLTQEVERNHPAVPEATTTFSDGSLSGDENTPTVTETVRPTFSWIAPDEVLADVLDAPERSAIKYTYEFSHYRVGAGEPISPSDDCPMITSSGALYSVDNFIPTEDCDPVACAASLSDTEANDVACRINVQTFLVDEYDNYLGQGAGNFRFFCVDINADGECN